MSWENQFLNASSSQRQYEEKAERESRYKDTCIKELSPRISNVCTKFAKIMGWKFQVGGGGKFWLIGNKMTIEIAIWENAGCPDVYVYGNVRQGYKREAELPIESFSEEKLAKALVDIADSYRYGYL